MEINPDNRIPLFITLNDDGMDQDQELDEMLSGEEREQHRQDLEDVQAMFRNNITLTGGRQQVR